MNELDLTNTQSIILLLVMVVILLLLKRMESHRHSDIKQVEETPSDELSPCYGRYIQLGMVGRGE
jgi:conserved domain protein